MGGTSMHYENDKESRNGCDGDLNASGVWGGGTTNSPALPSWTQPASSPAMTRVACISFSFFLTPPSGALRVAVNNDDDQ